MSVLSAVRDVLSTIYKGVAKTARGLWNAGINLAIAALTKARIPETDIRDTLTAVVPTELLPHYIEQIRSEHTGFSLEQAVLTFPNTEDITRDIVTETTLRRARDFRFIADATYFNPLTGEERTRTVSWYRDGVTSIEDSAQEWAAEQEMYPDESGFVITRVQVFRIYHNSASPWK